MERSFIRISTQFSAHSVRSLTDLGAFIGKYSTALGYFEAVADDATIQRLRSHGWEVFDGNR